MKIAAYTPNPDDVTDEMAARALGSGEKSQASPVHNGCPGCTYKAGGDHDVDDILATLEKYC